MLKQLGEQWAQECLKGSALRLVSDLMPLTVILAGVYKRTSGLHEARMKQ